MPPAPALPPVLDGTLVLDLSTAGPAARAARILADFGARVVKVGAPPRKAGVQNTPPFYAYSGNRGMQLVQIDLKAPASKEAFLRLADGADVVIESYRPGVADRLGIGYAALSKRNPRIVVCSTSGYGQSGPASQRAGHDLNYAAVSGYLDCTERRPDGGPPLPGASIADGAGGGMHAAMSILAALLRRERTGRGEYLDVSVADGMLYLMSIYVDEFLATGAEPGPRHYVLTGRYACYGIYEAGDGGWLSLGIIEAAFWKNLCEALGLEKWVAHQYDDAAQPAIRADLAAAFRAKPRDAWVAELADRDTCIAPVYSVAEATDDPQFRHRGVFVEAEHEEHGRFRQLGPTFAAQTPVGAPARVPNAKRTHTREVLAGAGIPPAELDAMIDEGLIA